MGWFEKNRIYFQYSPVGICHMPLRDKETVIISAFKADQITEFLENSNCGNNKRYMKIYYK